MIYRSLTAHVNQTRRFAVATEAALAGLAAFEMNCDFPEGLSSLSKEYPRQLDF